MQQIYKVYIFEIFFSFFLRKCYVIMNDFFPLPLWCDYLPFSLLICGQDNVCVCLPDTVKIFISIWQREMFYFWQNTIQWLLINEEKQPLNTIIYCLTRKETRENKIQTGSYSKVWLFLFSNQIHLHSRKHTIVVALEKIVSNCIYLYPFVHPLHYPSFDLLIWSFNNTL